MAAAPTATPGPTLISGAADAEYNTNLATIEHGENVLIGNAYGKTGEIGGELGQQIANVNERTERAVGPNYATKGELGGSLGLAENERTRGLSGRAGANIQSGIYGTERANTLLGFTQRAQGVEQGSREARERIQDRARKAWEADQAARATAVTRANNRYQNYVARNPGPAVITAAQGGPPGSAVNTGPGSPGQPIRAGFNEAVAGGPGGIGGETFGPNFVRIGPPPARPGRPPRRR